MNKDKKIELQTKIINDLQREKKELQEIINKFEKIIADNQVIIKAAEEFRDKYEKTIASLAAAREEYLQSNRKMIEQKNKYKIEMDKLLKSIRKNI